MASTCVMMSAMSALVLAALLAFDWKNSKSASVASSVEEELLRARGGGQVARRLDEVGLGRRDDDARELLAVEDEAHLRVVRAAHLAAPRARGRAGQLGHAAELADGDRAVILAADVERLDVELEVAARGLERDAPRLARATEQRGRVEAQAVEAGEHLLDVLRGESPSLPRGGRRDEHRGRGRQAEDECGQHGAGVLTTFHHKPHHGAGSRGTV
jgi:hypothetical protein